MTGIKHAGTKNAAGWRIFGGRLQPTATVTQPRGAVCGAGNMTGQAGGAKVQRAARPEPVSPGVAGSSITSAEEHMSFAITRSTAARLAASALSIGLFLACGTEPAAPGLRSPLDPAFAKGGGGTPVTVTIAPTSPGLLPSPDNVYPTTSTAGSPLSIAPSCSSSDRLDLQGMGASFDALGTRSTCNGNGGTGFMFLRLHVDLTTAVDQACPDQDAPQPTANGWNFGVASRYFFQVDGSDADTKFDDTQYTLVLKDCWVHSVPGEPAARRVSATVGDLYAGQTGTPVAGFADIAVNVDLTFRP